MQGLNKVVSGFILFCRNIRRRKTTQTFATGLISSNKVLKNLLELYHCKTWLTYLFLTGKFPICVPSYFFHISVLIWNELIILIMCNKINGIGFLWRQVVNIASIVQICMLNFMISANNFTYMKFMCETLCPFHMGNCYDIIQVVTCSSSTNHCLYVGNVSSVSSTSYINSLRSSDAIYLW